MIAALGGWLTPTRSVGMASFGCAAVASGIAWARLTREPARLPMLLTFIHSLLFLDIVFNWRWQLHAVLQNLAMAERLYESRSLPQVIALLALGSGLAVVCVGLLRSQWRRKGALLALLGTGLGLASWCMEVISLHAVDRILYEPKGPFMPVTTIWILVGLMTTAGISLYAGAASRAGA